MRNILLFIFAICLFSSCGSSFKRTSYLQDLQNLEIKQLSGEANFSLTIHPDDELLIIVSALDPVAAAPYNLPLTASQSFGNSGGKAGSSSSAQTVSAGPTFQTYLVNADGFINFPGLGKIKAAGMTKDELISELEKQLSKDIKDPIVNVQIVNFRVSIMGEVAMPGSYIFNKQRVSIFEALAAAQDITLQGCRDRVMIVRDVNGKKDYIRIDLTKSDVFDSPNYYLQQNDIVYVVPNREKQRDADFGVQKQFNTSIIISAISTVISIIAMIIR
jgi:polysaccharide export outer membrane protein